MKGFHAAHLYHRADTQRGYGDEFGDVAAICGARVSMSAFTDIALVLLWKPDGSVTCPACQIAKSVAVANGIFDHRDFKSLLKLLEAP